MRTLEELDLVPAWVNPDHLVATAIHVMQGHKINAVAVVGRTGLEGMVALERANAMPKFAKCETITQAVTLTLPIETSVRGAAKQFIEHDVNYAAVYRGGEFRGLLTANMLLREIGQSWDPLTSLPWSNRLRDWGMAELEAGSEITIVFIDIDDFGAYNKRHGHIVGDRILKLFAARLREVHDRHNDILVRYGGDEFVIGTLLDRYTAERRLADLAEIKLSVEDVPDPVTVSVGFAGGMRAQTREHAHVASMLDNLINLASQDCTKKKELKAVERLPVAPVVESPVEPEPVTPEPSVESEAPVAQSTEPATFDVRLVSLDEEDPTGPVAVTLRIDGADGTAAAMPDGRTLIQTVADATAKAIERVRADVAVSVSTVVVDTAPDGSKNVTVVGSCERAGKRAAITATVPVARDVHRAVAEAVATAFVNSLV
jgi:IMP dehydrogenase